MQQLEKKLREGTDPPVKGKWNTVNNPHEERYQSKLQDIQKERKATIEVSFFPEANLCVMCYKDETHQKPHRYQRSKRAHQMAHRTVVYKLGERHSRQLPEWWMSGCVDTTHAKIAKGCNCASANVP